MLFLRLFEGDALAERRVEFHELNLAFYALLILASPDDVFGLRGFESDEAVLRHATNVPYQIKTDNDRSRESQTYTATVEV